MSHEKCKWIQNRPCKNAKICLSKHQKRPLDLNWWQSTNIDKNAIMYMCVCECLCMLYVERIHDPWHVYRIGFILIHFRFNEFSSSSKKKVTNWKNLHHLSSESNYYQNVILRSFHVYQIFFFILLTFHFKFGLGDFSIAVSVFWVAFFVQLKEFSVLSIGSI